MKRELRASLSLCLLLTFLAGGVYPLAVWLMGQALFTQSANGGLLLNPRGEYFGAKLIGQNFTSARYFWPRPSSSNYDPLASGGRSHSEGLPAQKQQWLTNLSEAQKVWGESFAQGFVPADALTASASGLDPDVSPAYARLQVARIASARGMAEAELQALLERHIKPPTLGVFGQARINLLELNMALDALDAALDEPDEEN